MNIERGRTELPSSTIMVAIALSRQRRSVDFSSRTFWTLRALMDWAEAQKHLVVLKRSVEYLSLVHYVTEIANGDEGIGQ